MVMRDVVGDGGGRCGVESQRSTRFQSRAAIDPLEVLTALCTPPKLGMRCGLGDPSAPLRTAAFRGSGPRIFEAAAAGPPQGGCASPSGGWRTTRSEAK